MKNISIKIGTLSALFCLLFSSCQKKLDVKSPQNVSAEVVLSSDENVKKTLNGAYDALSNAYVLGGDMQLYSELLAANGEIRWSGTYNQPREIYLKQILVTNSFVLNSFDNAYKVVNICNNVLSAIGVVKSADQARVQGEALFLRGLVYFQLVELYAKPYSAGNVATNPGMQLISTPTVGTNISDSNFIPRSSVQQTYDFVINDLTKAEQLLPNRNGVFANRFAAAAVLSRVYLQTADYAKARDEANTVISEGGFSLNANYADAFNNAVNTPEDIFAIQVSALDGSNDMQLFWSITDYGARDGDVDVLQKHIDLYEGDDARKALFYKDGTNTWRSGKWKFQYRDLSIIRLAEMYLTRAECNFRLGTTVGATPFADIQTIRSRVGLPTSDSYITLDNILRERKLELAHEGQGIEDVKRLMETVDGFAYNANALVLPIPQREIDASKGALKQNEGY